MFLQNSRNLILYTYWSILFIYLLLHCIMYVCLSTYAKEQQTVLSENPQDIFQKGFIWLVILYTE